MTIPGIRRNLPDLRLPLQVLAWLGTALQWTQWIATFCLGLGLGFVSYLFRAAPEADKISLILLYVTAGIGIFIWIVFRHFLIHGTLDEMKRLLSSNRDLMDLQPVSGDPAFDDLKDSILKDLVKIRNHQTQFPFLRAPGISEIMDERIHAARCAYSAVSVPLASGVLAIDTPNAELKSNFDFIKFIPKHNVRAISYFDEHFWTSSSGKNFLEYNRRAIQDGISIERIFVLRQEIDQNMRNIMTEQVAIGVLVYFVSATSLAQQAGEPEDFVIYDNIAVRAAQLIPDDPTTPYEDKAARLIYSTDLIKYIRKYEAIKVCSSFYRSNPA